MSLLLKSVTFLVFVITEESKSDIISRYYEIREYPGLVNGKSSPRALSKFPLKSSPATARLICLAGAAHPPSYWLAYPQI